MKIKLVLFFMCLYTLAYGQHTLKGRIENYSLRELNICTQFGEQSKLEKTITTDLNGELNYTFDNKKYGLYRIYLDTQNHFDIIFYNEDVEFTTRAENPQYTMTILKSEENKQYYEYLINALEIDYKIDVLNEFMELYPGRKFTKKIRKEVSSVTLNKNKNIEKAVKINPASFTGRLINYYKEIIPSAKYNDAQKINYIKANYWKYFKMTDAELLHSDIYNHVVINYLKLSGSPNPQSYYMAAKDIMDNVFFEDPQISAFVLEYILTGFEIMGLHQAMADLSYEYGNICKDSNEDNNLKLRIKSSTELAIGKKAPDFLNVTTTGEKYKLSDMKTDYTLIIFWATWCEHCTIALPYIAKQSDIFKQLGIDIVTVNLDTERESLAKFIAETGIPFKIISDLKGWNSEIVIDYAVYGTPTFFIVDKELNIVSKPYNEDKLLNDIEKLLK